MERKALKIRKVTIWEIPLKSHQPYYMSDHKTCDSVLSVILRIDTDTPYCGWGEVCPIPHYLPAYAEGVIPAVQNMAPILIGADPIGVDALMERLNRHLIGHDYAKSAIDIACWDIMAKAANLPLHCLLGGRMHKDMPLYHSITCCDPAEMVKIAKDAQNHGIKQFQAKLGADDDWQMDVERMIKIREQLGSAPLLYGDWNCGPNR
ncbi:MAG: mandelate racemase, partial [Pseudomonadota bacterium]